MQLSVIIPCYNQGGYLAKALQSLETAISAFLVEVIIVNDGSTDQNTINIINALDQQKYQVIHQQNQGLAMARNNGIKQAKGKYIMPLDADNYISDHFISKAIQLFEQNDQIDIIYSDHHLFGSRNEVRIVGAFNSYELLRDNYIDALAIYKKTVWEKNGGYDRDMPFMGWEDWDFWIRSFSLGFNFFYVNEPLFYYRVAEDSMLRSGSKEQNMVKIRAYLFEKYPQLYHDFNLFLDTTNLLRKGNADNHFKDQYILFLEANQLSFRNLLVKIRSKLFK